MKKIAVVLVSFALGFLSFPLAADLSQLNGGWHQFFVLPGYGVTEAFNKHCTKDISRNGHGRVFINRDFFGCGKVNVMISDLLYGERTRPVTEKDLKALHDFEVNHKLDNEDE